MLLKDLKSYRPNPKVELLGENMLATYERKKVTEYTSFNYEFKVFYKDEYVCDLLKIGCHEWAFSAFQSCDKLEGLQMFLYNKTSWETFKKKEEAIQHLENVLAAYEAGERPA